jgi:AcrR family transcriptional regulator
VAGATDVLYRQGVERSTLAQIAAAADVPPGNVYYYFKTRDALVHAVIESRYGEIGQLIEYLGKLPDPRSRLKALIGTWTGQPTMIASYGCPIGTLCQELVKVGGDLGPHAATMLRRLIDFAGEQFEEMGRSDGPALGVTLLAGVQGAMLLSNTFHDPDLLLSEGRRLEEWIDSIV